MKTLMMSFVFMSMVAVLALLPETAARAESVFTATPDEINWSEAPPDIPKGAELAVIDGDIEKKAPFVIRVKFPPGYELRPHVHPVTEYVTVISGTLHFGSSDNMTPAAARAYPAGSVIIVPAGSPMFAYAGSEEVVFQVNATGPWGISYINPEDDPRTVGEE